MMPWQDLVLSLAQILFLAALLPAMRSTSKPPRVTCLLTAVACLACSVALLSLTLYWSAGMNGCIGICWTVMAVRR
jgi:hypothetical protein